MTTHTTSPAAPDAFRYVEANGVRFAYLEEGAGPLVLLLHGFPDTAHTWDQVRPALARAGYRAVSPFLRGYWPSAVPTKGRYDVETLGRDALALIEALGGEQAVLVGHDWGACAAYAAAQINPALLRLLVTMAIPHLGALLPSPRIVWGTRHVLRFQLPGAEAHMRQNDFAYVDQLVRRWSPTWDVPPGETDAIQQTLRHPGCVEATVAYYRALGPSQWGLLSRRIAVPSAVFCGADDPVLLRKDYERAARFYDRRYEIVEMPGGHFLHREHPDRFIRELLRVLG